MRRSCRTPTAPEQGAISRSPSTRRWPACGSGRRAARAGAQRRPVLRVPARGRQEHSKADDELIEQGRKLFTVGCSSCHGLNAEGVVTKGGRNYGPPLVGVGAAAVDFQVGTGRMPTAAARHAGTAARRSSTPTRRSRRWRAYIASLGPGPAIPERGDDRPERGRRRPRRRDSSWPTARPATTSPARAARCRTAATRPSLMNVEPLSTSTRPCSPGRSRCRCSPTTSLTPEDKRDIIAYIDSAQGPDRRTAERPRQPGPVSEGLWGWLLGIGGLVLVAVWIGNNGVRAGKKKRMSDDTISVERARRATRDDYRSRPTSAEPIPDPGLPEHEPRPTDVDAAMEKRAERQVAGMFVAGRGPDRSRSASPTSPSTRIPAGETFLGSAPPT